MENARKFTGLAPITPTPGDLIDTLRHLNDAVENAPEVDDDHLEAFFDTPKARQKIKDAIREDAK